jgi:hypothetical protein
MGVKQEKVRLFLLREQEFQDELARLEDPTSVDQKVASFESLLMDCKDAIQVNLSNVFTKSQTISYFNN